MGKIPPNSIEIEKCVLGALILEPWKLDDVVEILPDPECFYKTEYREIYSSVLGMADMGISIDLATLYAHLEKKGKIEQIGGVIEITEIVNSVTSSASVKSHALIVRERWMKRRLIELTGKIYSESYSDDSDVFDLIDELSAGVDEVSSSNIFNDSKQVVEILPETLQKMEELRKREDEMTGVPSGFRELDKLTNGWQNTDLIILAARPSVGKTALALNFAFNASKTIPVLFFSLEMSTEQLVKRLMSISTQVPLKEIRSPRQLTPKNWQKIITDPVLQKRELFIDDQAGINLQQIRAKSRRRLKLVHKNQRRLNPGVEPTMLIVIDYLQLIEEKATGGREQVISKISRGLKKLAKDLNVPVIALSQLNRAVENRSDNKPNMADIRESGAIEQDADVVMFTYRPARIEIDGNQAQGIDPNPSLEDANWLDIAKHRNGDLDTILLHKDLSIQTFSETPIKITDSPESIYNPFAGIPKSYDTDDASLRIDESVIKDNNQAPF